MDVTGNQVLLAVHTTDIQRHTTSVSVSNSKEDTDKNNKYSLTFLYRFI